MPLPSDLVPPSQRCEICGEPAGSEPHWVTSYPDVVHERCRDWSRTPWPWADRQAALRRLYRELRGLIEEIELAGRALAAMERRWPAGGAAAVQQGRKMLERVQARVARLGIGSRWVGRR